MTSQNDGTPQEDSKALSETQPALAVLLAVTGILLSMFLVALDRTIVSTAIPQITNDFHSLDDYGWYGSAYLLTCCALQLLCGRVATFFAVRYTLLLSILAFETGSAICGAAPSSAVFIVGRAISGIGAAGIFAGAMTSMIHIVPLHHKPKLFAAMGSIQTIAQIGGPLIGGALTTHASFRWCFYLNLPIGGLAMAAVFFFLNIPQQADEYRDKSLMWKLCQLDTPGTVAVASGAVCILLALQWGGQTYAWNNVRIVVLLTVGSVCLVVFGMIQVLCPETATLPPRLFKNRTVVAAFFLFICISSSNFVMVYYIPNWFQAIAGVSAVESGIRTIPLMAAAIVGLLGGGIITTVVGYYVPCAILGACLSSLGAGLIATQWTVTASRASWIGFQALNGLGVGMVLQIPNLAMQAVLPKRDAPTAFATALFGGLLAAALFIAVSETVLVTQLVRRLAQLPGLPIAIDSSAIYCGGATTVLQQLPADEQAAGLAAYNDALRAVFRIGLILSCLSVPAACVLEWKSVAAPWAKKKQPDSEAEKGAA